MAFTKITKSCVPSKSAHKTALRKRNRELTNSLNRIAGSSDRSVKIQTSKLLNSFDEEQREEIPRKANIKPRIEAQKMVAMKCQLEIPWEQLRGISQ